MRALEEEEAMKRLPYQLALAFMVLVLFVPNAWAQGQNVTVSMEDNFFDGADITVPVGTTVTWVQNGDNPHTTTSYDGLWDSGLIAGGSGGTFSFTFDEPGTYAYFCRPHEAMGMVGTVTVTGGGGGGVQTQTGGGATAPASMPETGGPRPPSLIGVALAAGAGVLILAATVRRRAS